MNPDQIRALAELAGISYIGGINNNLYDVCTLENLQEFAKLVIRDCSDVDSDRLMLIDAITTILADNHMTIADLGFSDDITSLDQLDKNDLLELYYDL